MNAKQNKYQRRDKKRNKRKHGMRVNGRSVVTLYNDELNKRKGANSEKISPRNVKR